MDNNATLDKSGPLGFGCVLDGKGGARRITWAEAEDWKPSAKGDVLWLHLNRDNDEARDWIEHDQGIPRRTTNILLSRDSMPTAFSEQNTLVAVLRGVGTLKSHRQDSLILVQLWSDGLRLISLRDYVRMSPKEVMEIFGAGDGPVDAASLFTWLVSSTIDGMGRAINEMDDEIDKLEQVNVAAGNPNRILRRISEIRRDCLSLQRHMGTQHEALQRIANDAPAWFEDNDRHAIHETINRLQRYLFDIEISKQSAASLLDEIRARSASRTRFTNMVISVISTIFLPLTFLTGLLGINVGGIPGAKDPQAFWIVVGICAVVFVLQLMLISRMGFPSDDG